MNNRNTQLTAVLFVVVLALASIVQAAPTPQGGPIRLTSEAPQPGGGPGPTYPPPNEAPRPDGGDPSANSGGEQLPVITIHSTDNVTRGETGSFVLSMNSSLMLAGIGMYVNFSVSGTAIPGVDYVAVVSPAHIGQSGYGSILIKTLPNPRGSADRQAYSVVVTLKSGAGYTLAGVSSSSATMWIKP